MQDWWERHGPPGYMSSAAMIGYKAPETPSRKRPTEKVEAVHWSKDVAGLIAQFNAAGGSVT